jgi:hypothetical protein
MHIKVDLSDLVQSRTAYRALVGIWGAALSDTAAPFISAPVVAALTSVAPVVAPAVTVSSGVSPAQEEPSTAAVMETPATPVADLPEDGELTALLKGRPQTKLLKLSDGVSVSAGDEVVHTVTKEALVVVATVRGVAITVNEAGVHVEYVANILASADSSSTVTPTVSPAVTVTPAPAEEALTGEIVEDSLPADYLLAELNTVGNQVKKAKSIAMVLSLLGEVSPGTLRLTELPVGKRQALLDKLTAALTA